MGGEKGQALPLAMFALAFGTLVISPFLGHAGSSLVGSRIYEQAITERYSCDSGIEYALWNLQSGELAVLEGETATLPGFTMNNKTVNVSVENQGAQVYKVVATATSADGHSTTIESYVQSGDGWSQDGDIGGDTEGDAYIDGDANIDVGATVDGSVYATGNITLGTNAEVTGDVIAEGELELMNNGIIGGDISTGGDLILNNNSEIGSIEVGGNVCAGGDVYLANNTIIYGSLYTTGNIDLMGGAIIKTDVYIGSDIATITLKNNARIEGSIYITGNITSKIQLDNNAHIDEDVYATGTINNIVREGNILGDVYENYTGERHRYLNMGIIHR